MTRDISHLNYARAVGSSTTRRLAEIHRLHGPNARTLRVLSTVSPVMDHPGYGLSIGRFTAEVAAPRQQLLALESIQALGHAGYMMGELLADAVPYHGADERMAIVDNFDHALHLPRHIVRLGQRWHLRLRSRAVAQAAIRLAANPGQSAVDHYRSALVAVVDTAPWSFQDRLLSAFEAADRELVEAHKALVDQLSNAAVSRQVVNPAMVGIGNLSDLTPP